MRANSLVAAAELLLAGTLLGVASGGVIAVTVGGAELAATILLGCIFGGTITAAIASTEGFLSRTRAARPLQEAPFLVTFGVECLVSATLITAVGASEAGVRLVRLVPSAASSTEELLPLAVSCALVVAFALLFMLEISRIVEPRTLRNIVLSRYHWPRWEERLFLSVDVVLSARLHESLDPAGFQRFLNEVFRLASDAINDHRGEIYQYVGDEIVVTWIVGGAQGNSQPIDCFFAIEASLGKQALEFEREFKDTPQLRATLHAGRVFSGEIGGRKRAILFHGDVMDAAPRLQQAARHFERRFVVSADALQRVAGSERYVLEPLGSWPWRGRVEPVELYAVIAPRAP